MLKTNKSELVELARSWLQPPELQSPIGCTSQGYDQAQRAYQLAAEQSKLIFTLNCIKSNPAVNPCFVIKNWNSKSAASLKIDGKESVPGQNFRQGIIRDIDGTRTLILWIKKKAVSYVNFEINR